MVALLIAGLLVLLVAGLGAAYWYSLSLPGKPYSGAPPPVTDAERDVAQPVPLHLRNAPTKLMKSLEYGKGYKYAHDEADGVAEMSCLPPALEGRKYYEPKERGFEKEIKRRLDGWAEIKRKRRTSE